MPITKKCFLEILFEVQFDRAHSTVVNKENSVRSYDK